MTEAEKITDGCPFCGTPARVEDGEHELNMKIIQTILQDGNTVKYSVKCIMCGARGPESDTPEESVNEWNNSLWKKVN